MELNGPSGSGRTRPLIYQPRPDENANVATLEAYLREAVPEQWRDLAPAVGALAEEIEMLPWADRAARIDALVWERARAMLSSDLITAVINRLNHSHGRCYAVIEYSTCISSVIRGLLIKLDDGGEIQNVHQALTYALSANLDQRQAAQNWLLRLNSPRTIERSLAHMPGFAFAMMTIFDNDTAESFLARDAFWTAMLGG